MAGVVEVNPETREVLILSLRATRTRAAAHPPASLPPRYLSDLDNTIDDLITGRLRLVRGTDEAWRELGLTGGHQRPVPPVHPPTRPNQ